MMTPMATMERETVRQAAAEQLALLGGPRSVTEDYPLLFQWPIVTAEDEAAVLAVMRAGAISGTEITRQFEREFAAWNGVRYALATCNGTAALQEAMWACGVGMGDEIICPSLTYWASASPALTLGAAVHFADVDPLTLCLDPDDLEHRIGPRTKAIVVVHYAGHPADMDRIMPIARQHGVKVIEDVSHAQGSLYKGRSCGALGDIAAASLMCGKSLVAGEGGMILTDDRALYERCLAFGHYERFSFSRYSQPAERIGDPALAAFGGLPVGGVKHRMAQTASALGRGQLKHYPDRIRKIQEALNYFWDRLEGLPGIRAHRVAADSGSTMGGWYFPRGLYRSEELGGLSCERFCEALAAEGATGVGAGANFPLHLHPVFHELDLFRTGQPAMTAFAARDVRQGPGSLPVSERVRETVFGVPWFKHCDRTAIDRYVAAFQKVIANYRQLV